MEDRRDTVLSIFFQRSPIEASATELIQRQDNQRDAGKSKLRMSIDAEHLLRVCTITNLIFGRQQR